MLTVHATLLPNGRVQLPPGLAKTRPVPVLVTILEPAGDAGSAAEVPVTAAPASGKGSIANLQALLASPEFQALPKASPDEVEERIQALRNDWNDH